MALHEMYDTVLDFIKSRDTYNLSKKPKEHTY